MAGRIVVTGRVPEPALDILREAGELVAHGQETALPVEELHAAIAGAGLMTSGRACLPPNPPPSGR